jgi:predicted kinase
VDWDALDAAYPWVRDLAGCPQDPVHHAEGDVWIHTRLVCEALAASAAWQALPPDERRVLFAAALLHDVAKPTCTRQELDGHISARGHSVRGAILARRLLWRMGLPFPAREQVTALIRHHQVPFWLVEGEDYQRRAITVSQTARCDHLALLAEADAWGRQCHDQERLLVNVALFAEYCREEGCLSTPRPFPSDHSRFLYFQREGRDPDYLAHEDCRADVVLMSGLPGAGKDRWVRTNLPGWPVVSLDAIRQELGVSPTGSQHGVTARAWELARAYLRQGQSFVWNATNVSRELRSRCIGVFAAYDARVRIVYVEVPAARLYRQNQQRPNPVPESAIEGLLDRWEVPDLSEAHTVAWEVDS